MTDQLVFKPAFFVRLSQPVDKGVRVLGVFTRGDELAIDQWSPIHNEHTGKLYMMALATFRVSGAKLAQRLNVVDTASLDALQQVMAENGTKEPQALMKFIGECANDCWDNEIYSDLPFAEWPESAEVAFNVKLAA